MTSNSKEYMREYYLKNKESILEKTKEYHKSDKYKEYQKEYQKNDKYKEYRREYMREYLLKKKLEKHAS